VFVVVFGGYFLGFLTFPTIAQVSDVFALTDSINMVMELCPFDLKKVIENKKIVLTESHIKSYMKMTLQGLEEIHAFWVLHRVSFFGIWALQRS